MKTIKSIVSITLTAVLCLIIAVSSVPYVSALSKPKAPSRVLYRSDYAIEEHCLTFKPSPSGTTGYQVQVRDSNGKITLNKFYKSTARTKSFYKLDGEYVLWNFNKHIKDGQFYTVKVRAFNASDYKSGKPSNAKYSGWSSTYAAGTITGAKALRVNKNGGVRISWNKTKGATCYTLRFAFVDNKAVRLGKTIKETNISLSKIGNVSLKNAKKITMEIVPVKLTKLAYHGADWKFHKLVIK
jgi:hypothetical protein